MKTVNILSVCLFLSLVTLAGCTKEGIDGNSEIGFEVKHHSTLIPSAKVYIKYGAKEFPGTTTTVYDDSVTTDAVAHAHFHELKKGDYYLYGVGFDNAISQKVIGGIYVKLKANEELDVTVPVTE